MSALLITQLEKNDTDGRNREITGKELVELAWTIVEEGQWFTRVAGGPLFLAFWDRADNMAIGE